MQRISVILDAGARMPTKQHDDDACYDLYANENVYVGPQMSKLIGTGVHVQMDSQMEGVIRPRSGLTRDGYVVTVGTVDSGYTGQIYVHMKNRSPNGKRFKEGMRIAQIAFREVPATELVEVMRFAATDRGDGGFGSTGE